MNIIYAIITIILLIETIMIKKSDEKLNIFNQVVITTILLACYNMLICYIFNLVKLPITLFTLSIANVIIIIIEVIKMLKDKQIQKYYLDKKDIIFILIVLSVIVPIACKQYGNIDSIKYYATDATSHYNASKLFYQSEKLLINNKEYQSFMPFTYINEGIIYKILAPIIGEFNLYKIFIISDILIWAMSIVIFYLLLKEKANTWVKFIIICITSIIFTLGYPLNSMLTGFHYLQVGTNLILCSIFIINMEKLTNTWKRIFMFLINIGIIFSYNLFAPLVYIAEFIYFIYNNYKETNKIINRNLIIDILVTLFVPGILAVSYFILPKLLSNRKCYGGNK